MNYLEKIFQNHLFANYGYRSWGSEAVDFARNKFNVDGEMKSVKTTVIQTTKDLSAKGSLRLYNFISSSREVVSNPPKRIVFPH